MATGILYEQFDEKKTLGILDYKRKQKLIMLYTPSN